MIVLRGATDIYITCEICRLSEEQFRKVREFVNAHRINSNAPGYEVQNVYAAVAIKLPTIKND